ncbi:uncharacterized protein LOC124197832 isoform X2 [Daphnia pulex]|nr:uncharacterized protein LOC124197832 isoform X2 [Daphnia pulex]XP_046449335.1 uncharacterized protein LOC124197832 isoform X2 [Daphnia pulex]XP_046449336.1 uncharacterized protein LOC124197832 isoform X2 [Daphnia pulex]XP_046449338.1 uncharacterized protein LOC124197832 isoform X2 [Daphnia pulex]
MKEYKNDFIDLLNQDSEAQYRAKLIELYISKWNKDFCNYFNKNIDPDMPNMGYWVLRPFGILLLTTNQSESFNCTMKRFGGWKRSPVDLMAISLMRLDKFFQIKIARGRYGLGEYTLKEDFVDIYPKQGVVLPAIISLEEIIARVNGQKVDAPKENRDTEHFAIEPKKFVYIPSESAQERARNIISENRIHLSAAHHVWNVTGSSGEEYTVRLFRDGTRRLTCTCAATTTCTHLLAAMYSIDCVMTQSKKPNTTAMRKKARKRPYKKGGKKKPCEVDNVKIKRARKDESLPFLHQELLDEEILCTEEPENNSMEESNINASSAKKMPLVSSPKSPNTPVFVRRVKTRSEKPKNPIIDHQRRLFLPASTHPFPVRSPSLKSHLNQIRSLLLLTRMNLLSSMPNQRDNLLPHLDQDD